MSLFFGITEDLIMENAGYDRSFPVTLETTSAGKKDEWNNILQALGQDPIEIVDGKVPLIEIQSLDPVLVVATKAHSAWKRRGKPVMVEDVGFGFVHLDGFPGPLYAFVGKALGLGGILDLANLTEDRTVIVTQTIAFLSPDEKRIYVVVAKMNGYVPFEPRGTNGFGFDSIFVPLGEKMTLAEMSIQRKNEISMRRKAIEMLCRGEWLIQGIETSQLDGLI